MNRTAADLEATAYLIHHSGLHTGTQFANATDAYGSLDICAAVYAVSEGNIPQAFYEDEAASLALIESSERSMAAIRAISDVLDTEPCETNGVPDYIEHVSNWAAVPGLFSTTPPSTSEVIGRILRAAEKTRQDAPRIASNGRPGFTDAYGFCLTCRGHGALTTDGEEIPREELSPRRQQGYDLGHRFYRNTSKPCPDCDGQDRATDAAVAAYEASL